MYSNDEVSMEAAVNMSADAGVPSETDRFVTSLKEVVVEFANNVLEHGRDRYRDNPTPLFADGLNVHTGEHVEWKLPNGKAIVMSNMASQQNLFRTLSALSSVTGDAQYIDAAKSAIDYHFKHLADESGLLQWGGHRLINLKTIEIDGPDDKGLVHEFKNHFPYYELMFEVNPEATVRFIQAFWNAHVYSWENMQISRHGQYGLEIGALWDHSFTDPEPFLESLGLSFINAGNDLIYSAGLLFKLTGNRKPLEWCKNLAGMYVKARHPETKLGVYQFTQPKKREEEPADPNDPRFTHSFFGDRAQRQFGAEFGAIALEGNLITERYGNSIYAVNALMQLQLAEEIGDDAADLKASTFEGLLAFAKYAYIPETNMFRPLFTDGTDLSDYVVPRPGYFGKSGTVMKQYQADSQFIGSFARAFLLNGDVELWTAVRHIAKGNGLGDLGEEPGKHVNVNFTTENDDARALFAILDVYKATKHADYLQLCCRIANNIINNKFYRGYFVNDKNCIYANFDAIEPLALISLYATVKEVPDKVPYFIEGDGYLAGNYQFADGSVRSIYADKIYDLRMK